MLISEVFTSEYLSAADLKGQAVTVTIAHAMSKNFEDRAGESRPKPVISFQGAKKSMVLNKTNAGSIVKLYGDNTDMWIGKQIELYPAVADYMGESLDCIRLRGPVLPSATVQAPLVGEPVAQPAPQTQPAPAAPQPAPLHDGAGVKDLDDEIPF